MIAGKVRRKVKRNSRRRECSAERPKSYFPGCNFCYFVRGLHSVMLPRGMLQRKGNDPYELKQNIQTTNRLPPIIRAAPSCSARHCRYLLSPQSSQLPYGGTLPPLIYNNQSCFFFNNAVLGRSTSPAATSAARSASRRVIWRRSGVARAADQPHRHELQPARKPHRQGGQYVVAPQARGSSRHRAQVPARRHRHTGGPSRPTAGPPVPPASVVAPLWLQP